MVFSDAPTGGKAVRDFGHWLWKQFSEATVKLIITAGLTAVCLTLWTASRESAPVLTSLGWLLVAVCLTFAIVLLVGVAGWAWAKWASPSSGAVAAVDTMIRL